MGKKSQKVPRRDQKELINRKLQTKHNKTHGQTQFTNTEYWKLPKNYMGVNSGAVPDLLLPPFALPIGKI